MPLSPFQQRVQAELASARSKHGKQNSLHEGYAVLLEEVDEFWEEVRKRRENRNPVAILEELVQIAAMAQRTAEDTLLIGCNASFEPTEEDWVAAGNVTDSVAPASWDAEAKGDLTSKIAHAIAEGRSR